MAESAVCFAGVPAATVLGICLSGCWPLALPTQALSRLTPLALLDLWSTCRQQLVSACIRE